MALALVDADSIYFRAAYVTKKQNEIRKVIDETMKSIDRNVSTILFDDIDFMIAVKGYGNFRKDLYPDYKKNRKELDEEMKQALKYGHPYMVDKYSAVMSDGMEADDLVSIWAYEAREAEQDYIIVGIDKDLRQIPGNHYNFKKEEHDFVDDDTAAYNLNIQCLTGDSTDNIPGIKGIGPKKAAKLLDGIPVSRQWSRIRAAWRAHGAGNPALSRSLLRMLTSWEDYEDVKREIAGETSVSEQDVLSEQEQDSGLQTLSGGDERSADGDELAFWRQHGIV